MIFPLPPFHFPSLCSPSSELAGSLYPFCWLGPHHSFSITDDSQIKRTAEWRFKPIRLGRGKKTLEITLPSGSPRCKVWFCFVPIVNGTHIIHCMCCRNAIIYLSGLAHGLHAEPWHDKLMHRKAWQDKTRWDGWVFLSAATRRRQTFQNSAFRIKGPRKVIRINFGRTEWIC